MENDEANSRENIIEVQVSIVPENMEYALASLAFDCTELYSRQVRETSQEPQVSHSFYTVPGGFVRTSSFRGATVTPQQVLDLLKRYSSVNPADASKRTMNFLEDLDLFG